MLRHVGASETVLTKARLVKTVCPFTADILSWRVPATIPELTHNNDTKLSICYHELGISQHLRVESENIDHPWGFVAEESGLATRQSRV